MLTKIDCINLIQIELASGKVTADVQQAFPKPVISRLLGAVLDEICMKNPAAREETAIEYEFTPTNNGDGTWSVALSPTPMSGTYSFQYVKDASGKMYILRSKGMNNALSVLNPAATDYAVLKTSDSLMLYSAPQGVVRTAFIPNVYLMEDDDALVLPNSEKYLIATVIGMVRSRDYRVAEILNDSKVDR
jgi:hypothetical protein